jgi:hypothetical protein
VVRSKANAPYRYNSMKATLDQLGDAKENIESILGLSKEDK